MKISLTSILIISLAFAHAQSTVIWSENYDVNRASHTADQMKLSTSEEITTVTGRKLVGTSELLQTVAYNLSGAIVETTLIGDDFVENSILIDYQFDAENNAYLLHKQLLESYKSKLVVQKYDPFGNLIWMDEVSSPGDTSFSPHALTLVNDTHIFVSYFKEYNYPVIGDDIVSTEQNTLVNNYSVDGTLQWVKLFDKTTELYDFALTFWHNENIIVNDSEVYYFGYNLLSDISLVKLNITGETTVINDLAIENGFGFVQLTPDNNLLIVSVVKYRLSKMDLEGNIIWSTFYDTFLPDNVGGDQIQGFEMDELGNAYVTGRHYGDDYGTETYSNADILTLKYDTNGELVWENRYEYGINNADIGNCINLANGSVYIGGSSQFDGAGTDYDYILLRLDSIDGNKTGEYRHDGFDGGNDEAYGIIANPDLSIFITGYTQVGSSFDWTTQLLGGKDLSLPQPLTNNKIEIYPNPIQNNQFLTFTNESFSRYTILSIDGRVISEGVLNTSDKNKLLIQNLSPGIYTLILSNDSESNASSFVVQ